MAVLRCTEAFAFSDHNSGIDRVVRLGDLVDAKDPLVKGREQWFENVDTTVERVTDRSNEKTSGAPGEKAAAAKAEAELDGLRAEADKAGVKVDGRWGADKLREEIAAAKKG